MSEYDDLLPDQDDPRAGDSSVEPMSEEELERFPPLVTASSLLRDEEDPLAAIPSEPADDETPPDDAAPAFLIVPHKDRSMPSIYMPNGIAVGVWLYEEHYALDGVEVAELLVSMGLDAKYAAWYGKQRDGRIEADKSLAANPVVAAFSQEEERRKVEKERTQAAFIEAQKKKEKK